MEAVAEQGQEPLWGTAWTAAVLCMAQAAEDQGLGQQGPQAMGVLGVRIPLAVEPRV